MCCSVLAFANTNTRALPTTLKKWASHKTIRDSMCEQTILCVFAQYNIGIPLSHFIIYDLGKC